MKIRKDKLFRILIFFASILFILSCNKKDKIKFRPKFENQWVKDSVGCLNLRNKELSEKLISTNKLNNSSISKFKTIYGIPNIIESEENVTILIYYFDSICLKNSVVEESDKCYARFYFKNNKLFDRDYIS